MGTLEQDVRDFRAEMNSRMDHSDARMDRMEAA